jgi:hypothetical protein
VCTLNNICLDIIDFVFFKYLKTKDDLLHGYTFMLVLLHSKKYNWLSFKFFFIDFVNYLLEKLYNGRHYWSTIKIISCMYITGEIKVELITMYITGDIKVELITMEF